MILLPRRSACPLAFYAVSNAPRDKRRRSRSPTSFLYVNLSPPAAGQRLGSVDLDRHDHPPPAVNHDVLTDLDRPVAGKPTTLPGGHVLDERGWAGELVSR
jgi:hypothetical protein